MRSAVLTYLVVALAVPLFPFCEAHEEGEGCDPEDYRPDRPIERSLSYKQNGYSVFTREAKPKLVCDTKGFRKNIKEGPDICHHNAHTYELPRYDCKRYDKKDTWYCSSDRSWQKFRGCAEYQKHPSRCDTQVIYEFLYEKTYIGSVIPYDKTTLLITTATVGDVTNAGWFLFNLATSAFTGLSPIELGGKKPQSVNLARSKAGVLIVWANFGEESSCVFTGDTPQNFPKFEKIWCSKSAHDLKLFTLFSHLLSKHNISSFVFRVKKIGPGGLSVETEYLFQDWVAKKTGNLTIKRGDLYETGVLKKRSKPSKNLNFKSKDDGKSLFVNFVSGYHCNKGNAYHYTNVAYTHPFYRSSGNRYNYKGVKTMECLIGCPHIPSEDKACNGAKHRADMLALIKSCFP